MFSSSRIDINRLLAELLDRIRAILGGEVLAVYLYGSLVAGDFDPDVSDIDLLVVTSAELDGRSSDGLKAMHEDFARQHAGWRDRIEVAYVSAEGLRTFKHRSSKIGIISPGEPFHSKEAGVDWLINWYVVREQGVPLFGPAPELFIEEMSRDEWVRAVREHMTDGQPFSSHQRRDIPGIRGLDSVQGTVCGEALSAGLEAPGRPLDRGRVSWVGPLDTQRIDLAL